MSKLYVFGIGGTGSRVLRALTMLLASGVKCDAEKIVPIIIDPDDSAADMTRTVSAMNHYMSVFSKLEKNDDNKNKFFGTEIRPVPGMSNFKFALKNTRDAKFKDFIKSNALSKENEALVRMLFSENNLESDMVVGFKGNPNIGSVVLNQFADSQEYKDFATDFQQGDRIFIISSIFGGTGASGFPLLLKTLRNDNTSASWSLISKAKIGAVTVLPYFKLKQDDNSAVDSSTFNSKAKSALAYYERNISDNGNVDALFYVGDNLPATYENHDGGSEQRNNAHFVELVSALAILKFAATGDSEYEQGVQHYEYGLDVDMQKAENQNFGQVIFKNLGKETKALIQKPMTQFILSCKYMTHCREKEFKHQPWAIDNKLDASFFSGDFVKDLVEFCDYYVEWLREMDNNNRSFKPFNEDKVKPLFDIVNGEHARPWIPKLHRNYALFDSTLNGTHCNKAASREQKMMDLLYRASLALVNHKYNM